MEAVIDLDRLDSYLSSDDAPENCMMISDLDGFLTGVLCSPDLILPSEWLPVVWGEDGSLQSLMRGSGRWSPL